MKIGNITRLRVKLARVILPDLRGRDFWTWDIGKGWVWINPKETGSVNAWSLEKDNFGQIIIYTGFPEDIDNNY